MKYSSLDFLQIRRTYYGVLILFTMLSVAACTSQSDQTKASPHFQLAMSAEPPTLHPLNAQDGYSQEIHSYVLDRLMTRNIDTYNWEPALAETYQYSKDKKSIEFSLRRGVRFHDGKELKAHDVKFSFDAIFDDTFQAAHVRPYFENISKVEVIDDYKVRFVLKKVYFGNFDVICGLDILPAHIYQQPADELNKKVIGSGPYMLKDGDYQKGRSILLTRNPAWWGRKLAAFKNRFQFESIFYRFVKESKLELELLKKQRLDFMGLTAEQYVKDTEGPEWGKSLHKQKVIHKGPKGYGFVGWNLRRTIFGDRATRQALAHLMNREEWNKKFRYNMSELATGPWYKYSDYADPDVKALGFDVGKAVTLLKTAGWQDANQDAVLERNGQNFEFTLLFVNADTEKYLTSYQEDLRKVGIKMNLQRVEWNSFVKALDERKFDAVVLAWSAGSVDLDPKQIWHSSSEKGGSNFIGYANPQVDQWIDEGRGLIDKQQRVLVFKKVFRAIAEDAPYAFLFNDVSSMYAHTQRIDASPPARGYGLGVDYWRLRAEP